MRNDNDHEIAELARISIEELCSDEDLFDYFGYPPEEEIRPAVRPLPEPLLDEEIPF